MTVTQMEAGLNDVIDENDPIYTKLTKEELEYVKKHKVIKCKGNNWYFLIELKGVLMILNGINTKN